MTSLSLIVGAPLRLTSVPSNLKFWVEIPRDRHFRYCGRSTRNRPRSCRACNAAKTKCSFEAPCSRCTKKGIGCVYNESVTVGRRDSAITSAAAGRAEPRSGSSASLADGVFDVDDEFVSNGEFGFGDDPAMNGAQNHFISGNDGPVVGLSTQRFPLEQVFNFDELLAFEDDTCLADVSLSFFGKLDQQPRSWCAWMRRDISLSVVTDTPTVEPDSDLLTLLQIERPHAQHNANLVIQSFRSFPTMMLRRETFPWFIHPHSQPGTVLPEALSTCMSVAQMFASRTSETKYFLWRTIRAECRRIISGVRILLSRCSLHADQHQTDAKRV